MSYRWIGAILVFAASGGFGFSMASHYRNELSTLRKMITMLDMMECELSYHLTPLPELCRKTGSAVNGVLKQILYLLAEEMERQICPDVMSCMYYALSTATKVPDSTRKLMGSLGTSLGRFDLTGQLKGIDSVRAQCRQELANMEQNRDQRLRGYQTLGLCAGAALVIILA